MQVETTLKLTDDEKKGFLAFEEALILFKKQNKDFLRNKGDIATLVLFLVKTKRL